MGDVDARGVEHDDRLILTAGERGHVSDERRAGALVDVARIRVIAPVEHQALVLRRGVDDVVAVHDQKLLFPGPRTARRDGRCRRRESGERVAHAICARIDDRLGRALAKTLGL